MVTPIVYRELIIFSVKSKLAVCNSSATSSDSSTEVPNSAQTESVCAGALRVQLAGDAVYFGKLVKKKYIGDGLREIEYEDIKRANRLMYITAFLCELLSVEVMSLVLILL